MGFRAWGSDRWLSQLVLGAGMDPLRVAAAVLLFVALCARVLDAFEMIFVIIPIVAPALIFVPASVHLLDKPVAAKGGPGAAPAATEDEIMRQMEGMTRERSGGKATEFEQPPPQ